DRDAADAEQDHRRGRAALRRQPLHQPDRRALEVAGALRRCLHHATDRASKWLSHGLPPMPAPTACESANSAYVGQSVSSDSWVPVPTTLPSSMTTIWSAVATVEMRCATMTTVASADTSASADRTRASVCTSSAE